MKGGHGPMRCIRPCLSCTPIRVLQLMCVRLCVGVCMWILFRELHISCYLQMCGCACVALCFSPKSMLCLLPCMADTDRLGPCMYVYDTVYSI